MKTLPTPFFLWFALSSASCWRFSRFPAQGCAVAEVCPRGSEQSQERVQECVGRASHGAQELIPPPATGAACALVELKGGAL